ncbi:MAG: 2-dehydropantoate 2-reductase [Rhodospirillales bacterium]|nr:2-dehydropantoate 2-reductase [Rhodospirillales bacterium]
MRICVFGAGAVGGLIATRFAQAGHDVGVVARGAHLDAIRAGGLTLRVDGAGDVGPVRVAASGSPADLGRQDVVLVTLKGYALPSVAAGVAPLLGPDTVVVFLQNGVPWWYPRRAPARLPAPPDLGFLDPGGALERAVGLERVLGGIVYPSAEQPAPGVVRHVVSSRDDILVGEIDDRDTPRLAALRAVLAEAGFPSPVVPDLRHAAWNKLLVNASVSTLCCLAGHPMNILDRDPGLRDLARRALAEVLSVATSAGMAFDLDPAAMFAPERRFGPHRPSILQDFQRGRPLEIDALLTAPRAFAHAAGVPTPVLDSIAALLARKVADRDGGA